MEPVRNGHSTKYCVLWNQCETVMVTEFGTNPVNQRYG